MGIDNSYTVVVSDIENKYKRRAAIVGLTLFFMVAYVFYAVGAAAVSYWNAMESLARSIEDVW